jgi:hypothetical protein
LKTCPRYIKQKKWGEELNVIYYPFKSLPTFPPFLMEAIFVPERHLYYRGKSVNQRFGEGKSEGLKN